MSNQVVLVGRIVKEVEVKELESGKKVSDIILAVPRYFKNADGIYETDFVDITLWGSIAINVAEYCRKGDLIGIRGRIQVDNIKNENTGENEHKMKIIAERVNFLSSK